MRTKKEYDKVLDLHNKGFSKSQISRDTDIPRGTISEWIINPPKFITGDKRKGGLNIKEIILKNDEFKKRYSYILGLYLGDGYINKCKRTYRLRISLDKKYDSLNSYVKDVLGKLFPDNSIHDVDYGNYLDIGLYSKQMVELFPQHGAGKKHERKIELLKWQESVVDHQELLKGLVHSDGCYSYHSGDKVKHHIYTFTNMSEDIHRIFVSCCNKLGIVSRYNKKNGVTGVYSRKEVSKLHELIGDKENIK